MTILCNFLFFLLLLSIDTQVKLGRKNSYSNPNSINLRSILWIYFHFCFSTLGTPVSFIIIKDSDKTYVRRRGNVLVNR